MQSTKQLFGSVNTRRQFLVAATYALPTLLRSVPGRFDHVPAAVARMEHVNGGRVGVDILDTASGERTGYRARERFAMCSTFKFMLAAAVLSRVDRHQEELERQVPVPSAPLISNSPLTALNAGGQMSVADLCQAALARSDNTAVNLLLGSIGGPAGLTRFARYAGDTMTRLDRWEPALNEALPGDARDTTSPKAMLGNLNSMLLGTVLNPPWRSALCRWMEANETGMDRLRAHLPGGWCAADKTGNNGEHTSNDIAIFWTPAARAVIVCAYITQCIGPDSKRAAMLARLGELVINAYR